MKLVAEQKPPIQWKMTPRKGFGPTKFLVVDSYEVLQLVEFKLSGYHRT